MRKRFLLLLALALLAASSSALAQDDTQKEESPPTTPPAKPETIKVSDIATRSVQVDLQLKEIASHVTPKPAIVKIEEELPAQLERIDALIENPGAKTENASVKGLKDNYAEWTRYSTVAGKISDKLKERSKELETDLASLESLRAPWTRTREQLETDDPGSEAIVEIDEVLVGIADVEAALRERLDEILKVQSDVSERTVAINGILQKITDAIEEVRGRLLTIDSEPLWSALPKLRESRPIREFIDAVRVVPRGLQALPKTYSGHLKFHIGLIIVLLIGVFILRRRSVRWDVGDEALNTARHVLARPISVALFVALLFWRRIYPLAPVVVEDTMALLLIVTAAILVPKLVPRGFVMPILMLFALSFMNFLDGFLSLGITRRFLVLGDTLLAIALSIWWFYHGHLRARLTDTERLYSRIVTGAALQVLAASLIANTVGAVQLSVVLTSGVLSSSAAGVLAFVIARLAHSFFALLLRLRVAQAMNSVRRYSNEMKQFFSRLAVVVVSLVWLRYALGEFRVWGPVLEWLRTVFGKQWTVGTLTLSVASVIAFFFTLWLSIQISRFIRFFLREDILPRTKMPRGMPATVSMMAHYTIVSVGFLIAVAAAGIQLSQFAILFGALGVGIGFGLQSLVNNFVSGLILMFERPIQIGDTVEVGTLLGTVRRIGIRASVLRTFSGAEVIVPNGNLISGELVNWTLSDSLRRVELRVGVAYGTDPKRVIDILLKVAADHDKTLKTPEPQALFKEFGESSLNFELRVWTGDPMWLQVSSDILAGINAALAEAGITIPFPQRDLHVKTVEVPLKDAFDEAGSKQEQREPR